MKSRKYIIISIFLGLLSGPSFLFIAMLLSILFEKFLPATTFPAELPIGISLTVIISVFFLIIRKAEKKLATIAMVLLLLSSTHSVCFVYDLILIGPGPEQLTYMHLLAKLRDEKGRIDPNWVGSEWNFYKPKCYSEFCAERYENTSLEVAVFYYGKTSYSPIHSGLKYLYTRLFCGYTDSKTAYENYKNLFSNSGFLIEDGLYNFTAKNESTIVYCQLDDKFIMVVKVDRDEEYLLNQTEIMKGRF